MTDQKPTGVFIDLSGAKITAEQEDKARDAVVNALLGLGNYLSAVLLAIGTPVTGGELFPIGYINEDAIGGLATGVYQSASIFREEDTEHYDTVALVRQSDAQAQIAARDAEIARKDVEIERLWSALGDIEMCIDALPDDNEDYSRMSAREMRRQALEVVKAEAKALKGGAA